MKLIDELPPELQLLADVAARIARDRRAQRQHLLDGSRGGDLTPSTMGVRMPPMRDGAVIVPPEGKG